jgi:predicted DNA-binding transcriptional regulator AlpA
MARNQIRATARLQKETASPETMLPEADALSAIRVISEREAARAIGVSPETLRRMSARGEAPAKIPLSPRRIGYRVRDIAHWLETRARYAGSPVIR